MVNFKELMAGKLSNGDSIPEKDNPFYHRRLSGSKTWKNPNDTNSTSTVRLNRKRLSSDDGQIELVLKSGYYARFQIRTRDWGHYSRISWDSGVNDVNVFDENFDSYLTFTMYGGSAIAVSAQKITLSSTMKALMGNEASGNGTMLELTPPPGADNRLRYIAYGVANADTFVRLVDWGRDVGDLGLAVTEDTVSIDSEGYDAEDLEGGNTSVFDDETVVRVENDLVDANGNEYVISVGYIGDSGPFNVYVNGVVVATEQSYGGAIERAYSLIEEYRLRGIDTVAVRESGEEEVDEVGLVKGGGIKVPDFPDLDLKRFGAIFVGVVLIGFVGFYAIRAFATTTGQKAAGA